MAEDACLKRSAGLLGGVARRGGRFGSEAFILLPETDAATVRMLAEQVEGRIAALAIPRAGSVVADRVTVSSAWAPRCRARMP